MVKVLLKIKRYRQGINTWRRMLVFLTEENNEQKMRLAEALKEGTATAGFIEEAENYLNNFTRQDDIIFQARQEIAELEKLLTKDALEQEDALKKIDTRYKQLQKEMEKLEQAFNTLKFQFNRSLTAIP